MNLIKDFGKFNIWNEEVIEAGNNALERIFESDESSKIAVIVDRIADDYHISDRDIYIYNTYTDALGTINRYEYLNGVGVTVYEINRSGYTHMMIKCSSSTGYRRLAQPSYTRYEVSNIRNMFDTNAKIYL